MGTANRLEFPVGGYESAEDLSDKIEWEGGVLAFFFEYEALSTWNGTPLRDPLRRIARGLKELEEILDASGVLI